MTRKLPSDYLRKGWCQIAEARNAKGNVVDPKSRAAVAWCVKGAFRRYGDCAAAFQRAAVEVCGAGIIEWNDHHCRSQAQAVAAAVKIERKMGLR